MLPFEQAICYCVAVRAATDRHLAADGPSVRPSAALLYECRCHVRPYVYGPQNYHTKGLWKLNLPQDYRLINDN